ncbi:MAG: DUF2325 domain-containing protein [Comamonadaceae bacterium]|nr:DUF2325 domain-containing protein [Comamonadaceae bacterium]
MPYTDKDFDSLALEHGVLLRQYGALQRRCGQQVRAQAQEIESLQQQVVRLRACVIARDSALSWEREERRKLLDAIRGWPEHEVQALQEQASTLTPMHTHASDSDWLEDSLRGADLVVCQTGCISHGDYWRVKDHCKRTGKTCVLVEQPGALRIVRIHPNDAGATEISDSSLAPLPEGGR